MYENCFSLWCLILTVNLSGLKNGLVGRDDREMSQCVRTLAPWLWRLEFESHTGWLTDACNSRSQGSTFFWPPWAPAHMCARTSIQIEMARGLEKHTSVTVLTETTDAEASGLTRSGFVVWWHSGETVKKEEARLDWRNQSLGTMSLVALTCPGSFLCFLSSASCLPGSEDPANTLLPQSLA